MPYIIAIALSFLLQLSASASSLKDFSASYDLYHNGMYIGKSNRLLSTKNKLLTFTSTAKTAGILALFSDITVTETSKLRFKNNRLNFFSYTYNEKDSDKNEGYQLRLDKFHQFYNSSTEQHYPVTKNLHDTLGFTVAIMPELQAGKREIKYHIAEKDSLKNYTLKFIQKENLITDNGEISTLKMEHYDPQTKLRFTLWCAENMDFLPIRIRNINHKGDENLLNLTSFNKKQIYLELNDEVFE